MGFLNLWDSSDSLSLFQGPILALVLLGIITRRATATAGLTAIISGLIFAAVLGFQDINMLYIAFYSFLFSLTVILITSGFTRPKTEDELENLTYHAARGVNK